MALQFSYTLGNTSNVMSAAYARILHIGLNNAGDVNIKIEIWYNAADKIANKDPVSSTAKTCNIGDTAYNTYFSESALKLADKSLLANGYDYLEAEVAMFSGATEV